jgi:hypothetical protein
VFLERIRALEGERTALDDRLARANGSISFLQVTRVTRVTSKNTRHDYSPKLAPHRCRLGQTMPPVHPPPQVEITHLKGDRERFKGSVAASEARADELARELEAARQVRAAGGRLHAVDCQQTHGNHSVYSNHNKPLL